MRGGIQEGTNVFTGASLALDKKTYAIAKEVYKSKVSVYPELKWIPKIDKREVPGGVTPCKPDSGVFQYKGVYICAFEAKYQGARGNAIERWYKNATIMRIMNPKVSYITFACGPGAYGVIRNTLKAMHTEGLGGENDYYPGKNSLFLSEECFDDKSVFNIIERVLTHEIENFDNNYTAPSTPPR